MAIAHVTPSLSETEIRLRLGRVLNMEQRTLEEMLAGLKDSAAIPQTCTWARHDAAVESPFF